MTFLTNMIQKFTKEEKGQALTEYGLIIALVAVVLIGALGFLTGGLEAIFTRITETLNGAL